MKFCRLRSKVRYFSSFVWPSQNILTLIYISFKIGTKISQHHVWSKKRLSLLNTHSAKQKLLIVGTCHSYHAKKREERAELENE